MCLPFPQDFLYIFPSIWILEVALLAKLHKNPKNWNYIGGGAGRQRNVLTQEQVLNMSFMLSCNRLYRYYKIAMENDRIYKWELLPNSTADSQKGYWLLLMILCPSAYLKTLKSSSIMSEFQYCVETGLVTLRGGSQWHDWQKTEHAGSLSSHYMGGEEHLLQWKHRETVIKFIKLLPHLYSFPNYIVFIFFQVKFNRLKTTHTYLLNSYYSVFWFILHFFVFIHCYLTVIMGVQLLILRLLDNICILPLWWWMKLG